MSAPNSFGSNRDKALTTKESPADVGQYIQDTNQYNGSWTVVMALAAAVANITPAIQAGTAPGIKMSGDLSAMTLPVGVPVEISGGFTGIRLASGKVVVYLK